MSIAATILWLSAEGLHNQDGERALSNTIVGMRGETIAEVETHTASSVLWTAKSGKRVARKVRFLRGASCVFSSKTAFG